MHQKNFTLKQYGTWNKAEIAAKKWRRAQLKVLPEIVMNSKNRMTSRNQSGKVGVHLARSFRRKRKGRDYEYWRWIARWPGCPYTGGIGWSILSLGDDDAFALAFLSREMETISRPKVLGELERIYGGKRHKEIMKLKAQNV